MKKQLFVLGIALIFAIQTVLGALTFDLDDSSVTVPVGGSTTVGLTALDNGVPQSGVVLDVVLICKELTSDGVCNAGDEFSPSEVTVNVTTPTTADGKANVTITHDGSGDSGLYHYTVCDVSQGSCGIGAASVTGDFLIPEFTTIGAGLALLGAGAMVLRKRKN